MNANHNRWLAKPKIELINLINLKGFQMEKEQFIQEFNTKETDLERWQFVKDSEFTGFDVHVDNDEIFITFHDEVNEEINVLYFDEFGYEAIPILTSMFGVKSELV